MEKKITILASDTPHAQATLQALQRQITPVALEDADMIITIGGDGMMLKTLHQTLVERSLPVYGINRGSYGFLMNILNDGDTMLEKISQAELITLYPLMMEAYDSQGELRSHYAINEISLFRRTAQIAKLKVIIDDEVRMESLWCDGIIVATPAGSTAYNYAAYGSIVPLGSNMLSLTPISPFRPPRWRGALLNHKSVVSIEIIEQDKRPISAVADNVEIINVSTIKIFEDRRKPMQLLFNPDAHLADRILKQQFIT